MAIFTYRCVRCGEIVHKNEPLGNVEEKPMWMCPKEKELRQFELAIPNRESLEWAEKQHEKGTARSAFPMPQGPDPLPSPDLIKPLKPPERDLYLYPKMLTKTQKTAGARKIA